MYRSFKKRYSSKYLHRDVVDLESYDGSNFDYRWDTLSGRSRGKTQIKNVIWILQGSVLDVKATNHKKTISYKTQLQPFRTSQTGDGHDKKIGQK